MTSHLARKTAYLFLQCRWNLQLTWELPIWFWPSGSQPVTLCGTVLLVRGFVPKYRNIILAFHAGGPSSIPTGNIFFSKLERRQTGRLRKRDNLLRRGEGTGKDRPQDSLVLYKSFNALLYLSIYRYEQALQMPQKQFSYCLLLESGSYANSQPVFQKLKILEWAQLA